jgi:3-carboxy-cis,cis-muconate cycloisomerase
VNRLFEPGGTTPAMAEAVSDAAWVRAMLRFEGALATVHAQAGVVPAAVAEEIVAACTGLDDVVDVDAIGSEAVIHGSPVVPLVDALRRVVSADAAGFVHLDATSQDTMDTAMMLIARDALDLLVADLSSLAEQCADLAAKHRDTRMLGRTLLQPALPITFGCKAAGWLAGIIEARRRLALLRADRLAVQLGGPVGTLGGAPAGRRLVAGLATQLGLADPQLGWQTERSRVGELGAALALAAGAAAKIALDVILLSQGEVGEVSEGVAGRSSAMPHKRNPARSVQARAAFTATLAQSGVLLGAVAGEHERAAGAWQAEWPALTQACLACAGAVARTREALDGLQVDVDRMASNLAALLPADAPRDVTAAQRSVDAALEVFRAAG